jgi:hypothetical protein
MIENLKGTIVEQVKKTFKIMFGVDVKPNEDMSVSFNDDDLITKAVMHQNDVKITLRFVFPRALLKPLLMKLYPPALASHEITYEDAACEIANIVCNGVKTFLSENGYKLTMEIPKIDYGQSIKHDDGEGDNHLNINFLLHDGGFNVDFQMEEERPPNQQQKR